MLKNITSKPVDLRWDGHTITLAAGQTCKYLDPRVELRMKAKFTEQLELTPEPIIKKNEMQVTLGPVPVHPPDGAGPAAPPPVEASQASSTRDDDEPPSTDAPGPRKPRVRSR